jgi:hypothetical protein
VGFQQIFDELRLRARWVLEKLWEDANLVNVDFRVALAGFQAELERWRGLAVEHYWLVGKNQIHEVNLPFN